MTCVDRGPGPCYRSVMNTEHVATVLVQFSFATTVYSLIAAWYIWPRLRALPIAGALLPLLLLQAFRYLGLVFLISPVIGAELPRQFSIPVAFGDLATSILAIVACIKLRYGWRGGIAFGPSYDSAP